MILEKFAKHCRKPEGKMGLGEFSNYLGMKQSPIVEQIFNIYDKVKAAAPQKHLEAQDSSPSIHAEPCCILQDKIGLIPFRLFLVAHCLLYQAIKRIEILETIIKVRFRFQPAHHLPKIWEPDVDVLSFQSFDLDGKGYLVQSDLAHFSILTDKVEDLFKSIDKNQDDKITLEDLKELAHDKPELILLFLIYNELKQSKTSTSIQLEQVINDTETKSRSINLDIEENQDCDVSNEGTRSDDGDSDDSSTQPIVTCDSKAALEEIPMYSEDNYMEANLNDSDSPHEKLLVKEKKTYLLNSFDSRLSSEATVNS